jgi:glycerol-3-phosphate dehydrogenase
MNWKSGLRTTVWNQLQEDWDIVVIGGGITGAGIFRESCLRGLRVLLVEQRDFAWGTSSRSSKMVHGGLRYLKEGNFRLTNKSVHEREHLLREGMGLVEPLPFIFLTHKGDRIGAFLTRVGLTIYDLMARRWQHRYYNPTELSVLAPNLKLDDTRGGFGYQDAVTDDTRLVLRVLKEGVAIGGTALNYVAAQEILREGDRVTGVRLVDAVTGQSRNVNAQVVINATGAWAQRLHSHTEPPQHIRPLRGSHLVLPKSRLPVEQAISFRHPLDKRYVYIYPWEDVTLVGTTDLDHQESLDFEPRISPQEVVYLMAAIQDRYPTLGINLDDVISTFAGVRPVMDSGKANPSEESRDYVIWQDKGFITVTGGKLTTYHTVALEVLEKLSHAGWKQLNSHSDSPRLEAVTPDLVARVRQSGILSKAQQRLVARYGKDSLAIIESAPAEELDFIPGTSYLWAEIRWAAANESVVHLDDLLLRRVRLGLISQQGAEHYLPRIRAIVQSELGWDDAAWNTECEAYLETWNSNYSLPDRTSIPNWQALPAKV